MRKRTWFMLFGLVVGTWGCSFSAGAILTPGPLPPEETGTVVPALIQTDAAPPAASPSAAATAEPAAGGTPVTFEGLSFVLPAEVAESAAADKMTAVDSNSGAPWEIAPTHSRFTLAGYPLQDKFHAPRIYVYPAGEYAAANPGAAQEINRLRAAVTGGPLLEETLPRIPFFNAGPLLAAQIRLLPFQNGGGGVRTLTQYAQYAAPVNNHELFYHFQGLSVDGNYYVIAILPVTAAILPEDENPEAAVPAGGVSIPAAIGPNQVYYLSVSEKLNSLSPEDFTPSLTALDALAQSFVITTP